MLRPSWWFVAAVAAVWLAAPASSVVPKDVAFSALPDLELDLGADYGLSHGGDAVAQSTVMSVMQGVEKKNKDSLYFLGLLRLYGAGGLPEDHEKGAASIREAAELGHVEAQTAIGMLLLHGIGVAEDESAAAAWLRKATRIGDKDAQWILGKLTFEVEDRRLRSSGAEGGVNKAAFREATQLMLSAAEQESKEAFYYLGLMCEYGKGLDQDFSQAYSYYRQSANRGYVQALYNLALMVAFGRGVAQDYKEAYGMFQEGAGRNHAPSMYYCGVFSLYGHGIDVDYSQAMLWFDQAAQLEDPTISEKAALARDELSASLRKAKEVNAEMMAGFEGSVSETPGSFAMYDEVVEEAEEDIEAGMARARAQREVHARASRGGGGGGSSGDDEGGLNGDGLYGDSYGDGLYGDPYGDPYDDPYDDGLPVESMKRTGNVDLTYEELYPPELDDPYGDGLVEDFSGYEEDF